MSAVHGQPEYAVPAVTATLRLRGRTVQVEARADPSEISRRTDAGLGALTHSALLAALVSLPVGEPVPWSGLDRRLQRVLRSAPVGVVERTDCQVIRLAAAPLMVQSITVGTRAARTGLEVASMFAPFCRRSVSLPFSSIDEWVLFEAAFYGIGVELDGSSGRRVVLAPAPFVMRRWTWASWQFHEEAWELLGESVDREGRADRERCA